MSELFSKNQPMKKTTPLILALLLLAPGFSSAALLGVTNPGFEDTTGSTNIYNEFSFGPLAGWGLYDPGNVTAGGAGPTYFIGTIAPQIITPPNREYFPAGAPEGSRVAIAFNFNGSGGGGEYGLVQTLSDTLTANTLYTLRVLVGNIASGQSLDTSFFNLDGFPGYRIDLLAGSTVLTSDNNSLAGTVPEGEFRESTLTYLSGASVSPGQALGIRLVNLNVIDPAFPAADWEVDFDDVRLEAVAASVPEPSQVAASLVLLAGIGGHVVLKRRRAVKQVA
jgi:hypothetical protein